MSSLSQQITHARKGPVLLLLLTTAASDDVMIVQPTVTASVMPASTVNAAAAAAENRCQMYSVLLARHSLCSSDQALKQA